MQKTIVLSDKSIKFIELTTFLLFVFFALIVGMHHEPWADEAQSWLIARDTGMKELFSVMAYEGSPALWPLILKVFIACGLDYRHLYLVPLLFSALGVWLLIFKSDLPFGIRILLPFTYYIFYQYTIVARSYCLVLPCIELIALIFKDRLKKPYLYGVLLILLAGICVHTLLLSGILCLLYCLDVLQAIRRKADNLPIIHNAAAFILIGAFYLFTVWYLRTPPDCSFVAAKFKHDPVTIACIFLLHIGEVFLYNTFNFYGLLISMALVLIFCLLFKFCFQFFLISSTVWIFLSLFYFNKWHLGLIFLSFLLAVQLYPPTPRFKKLRKMEYMNLVVAMLLFIQVGWSINTAYYDYFESNSGAKAASEFIKEESLDQCKIYGLGYCSTAVEPYFEANIFANRTDHAAYYLWSFSNGYMTDRDMINNLPDVAIYSKFEEQRLMPVLKILNSMAYKIYSFPGATYIKDGIYESQTYYILVKQP